MIAPAIEPLGDAAMLIRLGDRIDDALNDAAIDLAEFLRSSELPGVSDIAPAYASVCVRYDVARFATDGNPFDELSARVRFLLESATVAQRERILSNVIEIPVCYGGEFGPDLNVVAAHCGIDAAQVITLHATANYTVAMLGFMPGFPYLRGLDQRLQTPRRATPRTHVPAGSVAIGGAQTGIYPRQLPGGWQLIGRTPLRLFDASTAQPALLRPGQRVRFTQIDAYEFDAMHA